MTSFTSCFTPVEADEGVELGEELVDGSGRRIVAGRRGRGRGRAPARRRRTARAPSRCSIASMAPRSMPRKRSMAASSVLGGVEVDGGDRERDLDGGRVVACGRGRSRPAGRRRAAPRTWPTVGRRSLRCASTRPESRSACGVAPASCVSSSGPKAPSTSQSSSSLTRRSIGHQPAHEVEGLEGDVLAELVGAHARRRRCSPPRGRR